MRVIFWESSSNLWKALKAISWISTIHRNDMWLFQNRIPGFLHHLTLTPFREDKRQRKYRLQTWPRDYQGISWPDLEYLLEYFLPGTFAVLIISMLPENCQKHLELGRLHSPSPGPYAIDRYWNVEFCENVGNIWNYLRLRSFSSVCSPLIFLPLNPLIIKITISSIVIGLEKSYFPLIHFLAKLSDSLQDSYQTVQ